MLHLPLLLAFVAAASVLTVTPGIDTAMVLRAATTGGPRQAGLAGIGIALGCLTWGAAVSLGLGALLEASELAYTVVKCAGAAYLIWLGANLFFKPRREFVTASHEPRSAQGVAALRRGFLTNLLNPKVGVFYVTFLPQFIPAGENVAAYSFLLASIHIVLSLIWFAILIAATAPLVRFLRRPQVVRLLDRLTGCLFIAFGLKLATSTAHR
jgi:threonine/homoserine/homoserine lactone efflux protein